MRLPALAVLLWALATPARAQVTIHADVNKTDVTIDEQIVLSVTVSGPESSLPEPQISPMANLSIYDSGRNQSLSIVNGQVSSSIIYTFVVIPRAVGKSTIGPISLTYKGQTIKTEPIEINVRKPDSGMPGAPGISRQDARRAAPQAAQGGRMADVFLTAELDKKKAFVNEQVTLSVKFYTAVNLLTSPQYVPPPLSGFLAEDLPPERHGSENIRGRTYYFSEIKTALFPAQAGKVTAGAAAVRCEVQQQMADPFSSDFFDRFFSQGMAGRAIELRSDPLALIAEPLPEQGKPAGFSGAVGEFSISAAVDRSQAKTGDAITLTVTVQGTGNLKSVGDPALPELPAFRAFETVSSLNLDKKQDVVRGSKVFKTVLVPRVSGDVAIPPIRFDYFDPKSKAYRSAQTAAIALKISPGEAQSAGGPTDTLAPRGITAVSQDLRYLKTKPRRRAATRLLEFVAAAGPIHGLPVALLLATLGFSAYRRSELADPLGSRARRAYPVALSRVKEAQQADASKAAELLGAALTGYLADALKQPASSLTVKRALELLRARKPNASPAVFESVREVWEELDLRRFAPPNGNQDHEALSQRLKDLLAALDRELSRR